MADIFISYASVDQARVKPLVEALKQRGWSVRWDRTILAGKAFDQVIEAALKDSRCVIVLWSRDSIDSHWVRTEANEGRRRGILVPAMLDDVPVPLAFSIIHAANLIGWSGALPSDQFDELARAVSDVLSNATIAAPNAREKQEDEEPARRRQEESKRLKREKHAERDRLEEESRAWAQQERLKLERKPPADQFEFLKRLERDSQTEAELERLEQEQKEPAERERLEREKQEQAELALVKKVVLEGFMPLPRNGIETWH